MTGALARLGRGARRTGPALVALVLAAVAIAVVWTVRHRPAPVAGTADVVRVGVAEGSSIPEYLGQSRARLAGLAADPAGYALVSLTGYLTPDQLVPVLAGVEPFQVYARVPLPHTQTAIVKLAVYRIPDDVTAGMDVEAGRRAEQAARTGDQVAATEATSYRQHCACVYAAVVRAPAAALWALAARDGVRAVDPAPQVNRLDQAVFLPPLPEQTATAAPPDDRAPAPVPPATTR